MCVCVCVYIHTQKYAHTYKVFSMWGLVSLLMFCVYLQELLLKSLYLKSLYVTCVKSKSVSHSIMSNSLWSHGLYSARLLCPWNSPGKNTTVGSHSILQGIFPTQRSNPGLPHCRQILYCLSHHEQGDSIIVELGTRILACRGILVCCPDVKLCLTLCDIRDCNTSDSPVLHHLLEFAQTHVHQVGDAI